MPTLEQEVIDLRTSLKLSPVKAGELYASHYPSIAAHAQKGFSAGTHALAVLSPEQKLDALTAETNRRKAGGPENASLLLAKVEALEAQVAGFDTERASFTARITDLTGQLHASKTAFTELEGSFAKKVNAGITAHLAASGHAPLPIGGDDMWSGSASARGFKPRSEMTPAEREQHRLDVKASAIQATNEDLQKRGLIPPVTL